MGGPGWLVLLGCLGLSWAPVCLWGATGNGAGAQSLLAGTWMLEALDVVPDARGSTGRYLERARSDVERVHPVGRTFVEFRPDGTFTILRGAGRPAEGTWALTDAGFSLRLDRTREDGPRTLPYRLDLLEADRLVLEFRITTEGAGTGPLPFRLHFVPSKWDLDAVRGGGR